MTVARIAGACYLFKLQMLQNSYLINSLSCRCSEHDCLRILFNLILCLNTACVERLMDGECRARCRYGDPLSMVKGYLACHEQLRVVDLSVCSIAN